MGVHRPGFGQSGVRVRRLVSNCYRRACEVYFSIVPLPVNEEA
jgi:hypothetical protein